MKPMQKCLLSNAFPRAISAFKCVQEYTFDTESPEKEREQKELLTARTLNCFILLEGKINLHIRL